MKSEFWITLFSEPKVFFREHWGNRELPGIFNIAIVLFLIGTGIDRFDTQLTKIEMQGKYELLDALNVWWIYWVGSVFLGLTIGWIGYFIGGWFYDLRVVWSKGTSDIQTSRHLFMYSGVIFYVIVIVTAVLNSFVFEAPRQMSAEIGFYEIIEVILLLVMLVYSVVVSYIGVTTVTSVNVSRARFWFLLCPLLFYLVLYSSFIYLLGESLM